MVEAAELYPAEGSPWIPEIERALSDEARLAQLEAELASLKAAGTFAEGVEAAAKVCDADAEASRVEREDASVEDKSHWLWSIDTATNLADRIRALSPPGKGVVGEIDWKVEAEMWEREANDANAYIAELRQLPGQIEAELHAVALTMPTPREQTALQKVAVQFASRFGKGG